VQVIAPADFDGALFAYDERLDSTVVHGKLMRRSFIILIVLGLFLSACGTLEIYVDTPSEGEPAAPPHQATAKPTLSLNSSSEEIQQAMLESATN